ncbi:MAG TPA: nucleotidyltransferase domain-containing protein [Rhizomicrobium sp.]
MTRDGRFLAAVVKEFQRKHRCHTLILYGSQARGEATRASDYDLLGVRDKGEVVRDARLWRGVYLDFFAYPERKAKAEQLMHVRGGKVLRQKGGFGDRLLARIEKAYAAGPKPLPPDELQARKVWARKMLARARVGDAEGNYRRAWLLTALLENYFAGRGRWYEGSKASLRWLRENDPKASALFEKALKPGARLSTIAALVERIG